MFLYLHAFTQERKKRIKTKTQRNAKKHTKTNKKRRSKKTQISKNKKTYIFQNKDEKKEKKRRELLKNGVNLAVVMLCMYLPTGHTYVHITLDERPVRRSE